jgi:signal-transduction protein with cAMP-binding, CBS, and nucleotidyltransferase domain
MAKNDMEVKKINLHEALTCSVNDGAVEIAKKLRDKKERRIFVVDSSKKLVGVITTTDLVYKVMCGSSGKLNAKDIMTKEVRHVDIADDLDKALEIMNSLKTFTCPVTQEGVLLGVISYHDLVSHVMTSVGG